MTFWPSYAIPPCGSTTVRCSVGEVSEVVGEYEGPEVGDYVRDLRERFENEDTSGN